MKISHEVPLDLLETSLSFNGYDYLLPHYYIKYPKYREFYLKSKSKGRFIIADNGLFEGEVLPEPQLLEIINEIKPDIFIVPDVWNSYTSTLNYAKKWLDKELPGNTNRMMVLQGKTYDELQECVWQGMKIGYRHFGLNHASLAYSNLYYHPNPTTSRMMGRILTFNKLIEEDVFDKFKKCYIHFLGVETPEELQLVNNKELISSIDTSNPIINGIKGIRYDKNKFPIGKPSDKIEVFMEKDLASSIEDIMLNISYFRKWCN